MNKSKDAKQVITPAVVAGGKDVKGGKDTKDIKVKTKDTKVKSQVKAQRR